MKAFFIFLSIASASWINAQSIVKKFITEEVPEGGRSFYLYQSTLRSFSSKNSNSFNKLIKDVEKISIHLLPDSLEDGKLNSLEKTLREEGYDDAKNLPEKVPGVTLLVIKEGRSKRYVALMQEGGKSLVVELDGEVNLLYLRSLREMDMEKVMSFFGVDIPKTETPKQTNE